MNNIDTIKPIFYISDENKNMIKNIENKLKLVNISGNTKRTNLKIKSKVRSIHSSLAIEANSLSLTAVENIIGNKLIIGERKEIQEVKNANELYENMNNYNWKDEEQFLKAHTIMMKYFEDDNGYYRNYGEGIKKGNKVIYTAPESRFVPSLMKSLFKFINNEDKNIHPLILSSIFHYYFVSIHPFSDGNGRMARFWVSLMLTKYNYKFEYIPIEEEIYLNQKEYYESISQCHVNGNANVFIDFMLKIINSSLEKTTHKTTQKLNNNQMKIIQLIKKDPFITKNKLASELDITYDGVKYNINKLIKMNIIERIGAANGGYWEVKDDNE